MFQKANHYVKLKRKLYKANQYYVHFNSIHLMQFKCQLYKPNQFNKAFFRLNWISIQNIRYTKPISTHQCILYSWIQYQFKCHFSWINTIKFKWQRYTQFSLVFKLNWIEFQFKYQPYKSNEYSVYSIFQLNRISIQTPAVPFKFQQYKANVY